MTDTTCGVSVLSFKAFFYILEVFNTELVSAARMWLESVCSTDRELGLGLSR
jgi:hypothetical protein